MRLERRCVCLVAFAGLTALARWTLAGEPPADPVEGRIKILEDLTISDDQRATARDELATDAALLARGSVARMVERAKAADSDNVRMHYCIAFASVRSREEVAKVAAELQLLTKWLNDKDADAALRYWAARAIARLRSPQALEALKTVLNEPTKDELVICKAVARELGGWRGRNNELRKLTVPVLVVLLGSADPEVRLAGIFGLRETGSTDAPAIVPLAALIGGLEAVQAAGIDPATIPGGLAHAARPEPEEKVWRAAETVLNELTRGMRDLRRLQIRLSAATEQRAQAVRIWLFEWQRLKRREAEEKAKKPTK